MTMLSIIPVKVIGRYHGCQEEAEAEEQKGNYVSKKNRAKVIAVSSPLR